jgi:ribosomal protein S3AE
MMCFSTLHGARIAPDYRRTAIRELQERIDTCDEVRTAQWDERWVVG